MSKFLKDFIFAFKTTSTLTFIACSLVVVVFIGYDIELLFVAFLWSTSPAAIFSISYAIGSMRDSGNE